MRRANGLIARYNFVLHEKGQSLLLYNMLIKVSSRLDSNIHGVSLACIVLDLMKYTPFSILFVYTVKILVMRCLKGLHVLPGICK